VARQGGRRDGCGGSVSGRTANMLSHPPARSKRLVRDERGRNKCRPLAASLDVRNAPSWSPDGKFIAVAAYEGDGSRVYKVPVDDGAPVRLVDEFSNWPVWSPDGSLILYAEPLEDRDTH